MIARDCQELLPKTYYAFFGQFPRLRSAQEHTIPRVLAGENVLLVSPTGSGKTEAVVAPVCEQALSVPHDTYCLYICPTRALVNDIERRIEVPLAKLQMKAGVRHGDRKTLRGKTAPNILITTPESLDVMLGSHNEQDKRRLRSVRTVIIDEAHQFYQTHRGYQLVLLLERLKRLTKAPLQRILLSATVGEPEVMAAGFQGSDTQFQLVHIPGGRSLHVSLDHLTAESGDQFRQGGVAVSLLSSIIADHRKVLLFANSRNECDWLYWKLHDQVDVPTLLHYSSLDKEHREMVEQRFQQAERALCIATSTLELGVDIGDIDAVVMYGAPSSISSFVQRIGRGNRRSGTCTVYGLCREYHIDGAQLGAEHDLILLYALVASMLRSELEHKPHGEMFSVLAQQYCSLAWQYDSVVREVVERVVAAAEQHPFASPLDLERILDSLCLAEVFRCDPQTHAYYPAEQWDRLKLSLQLWGNIASSPHDTVLDSAEDIPLSEVPRGAAQPGQVLLLAGEPRLVTNVDGRVVRTVRLAVSNPQLISYDTMGAITPPEVAETARELLRSPTFPDLPVHADDALRAVLRLYRQRFRNFDFDHYLPYTVVDGRFCYYTFAGTWANEIMAVALRDGGWAADTDSWRVYTQQPIQHLSLLPASEETLRQVIHSHIQYFVHRIRFSTHFYNLPEELQSREVCSLIDLSRVAECFAGFRQKTIRRLPNE